MLSAQRLYLFVIYQTIPKTRALKEDPLSLVTSQQSSADISHGDMCMWLDAKGIEGQTRGYLK